MHKPDYAVPFRLAQVRLNGGGYDNRGNYWGLGEPLYRYWYDTELPMGSIETGTVRAGSREAAKAQIWKWYPGAKFHK